MIHDNSHAHPKIKNLFFGERGEAPCRPTILQNSGGHEEDFGTQVLTKEMMKTPSRNRMRLCGQTSNRHVKSTQSTDVHDGRRR
jgi:hypothetical protein